MDLAVNAGKSAAGCWGELSDKKLEEAAEGKRRKSGKGVREKQKKCLKKALLYANMKTETGTYFYEKTL